MYLDLQVVFLMIVFSFLQNMMMVIQVVTLSKQMSPNLNSRRAGCGASLVAVRMWLLAWLLSEDEDDKRCTPALDWSLLSPVYPPACSANLCTS